MSNYFTGLSLGPPLGDQRLDLCDLYVFQSPADPARTAIILNANPNADALHPDAIYRLNIDTDGDLLADIAVSYVFSAPKNGKQTVNVFVAKGAEARSVEAVGTKIIADGEVSFGPKPNIMKAGNYTVFTGSRSDAFFFDYDGIKNLYSPLGDRNFTSLQVGVKASLDRRRFEHRGQRVLDGVRTADERARHQVSDPRLGTMQRQAGRQATPCRSRRPPVGQQLLQHRRDQARIQCQRADQRSQALDAHVRALDGPYRQLHRSRSGRGDRRRRPFARRDELRSDEAREIPQRPGLHRRRHRPSPRLPFQG